MTDINKMKSYLSIALELERYVHTWKNALNTVNRSISNNTNNKENAKIQLAREQISYTNIDKNVANKKKKTKTITIIVCAIILPLIILWAILSYGVGLIATIGNNPTPSVEPDLSGIMFVVIILFAVLIWVVPIMALIIFLIIKFKKKNWGKMSSDQKNTSQQVQMQINNALIKYDRTGKLLNDERNRILFNLHKVQNELDALYSLNYIHQKYRNLTAVASLLELLETGVCNTIEGHGGIYDTYESHLLAKTMISNLVEINQKMDVVIANQHMLYSEVQKSNAYLSDISRDIKSIESHTASIEKSAAVTAVASQQSAAVLKSAEYRAWLNGYN